MGLKSLVLVNDTKDKTDKTKTSDPAKKDSSSDTKDSANSHTVGLGIDGGIHLLTKKDAAHAHVALQGAMALIKQVYGQLNNPPSPAAATSNTAAPAYVQSQLAGYQTALAWMQTRNN